MYMAKVKIVILVVISVIAGVVIGGYLFAQSQPRSIISLNHCKKCLTPQELLGLFASIGIQKIPGFLPDVIMETDKTIVFKHPFEPDGIHYLIVPKKDIKNIGEISGADAPYLMDAFFVAQHIIEEKKLSHYRLLTNGPGFQEVAYLHFHLIGPQERIE
jgi:diadenosine tetraphosphate (Ap4A) HIT family hydrolase